MTINTAQESIRQWMQDVGQNVDDVTEIKDIDAAIKVIDEESFEALDALNQYCVTLERPLRDEDIELKRQAVKELADLLFVTLAAYVRLGIDASASLKQVIDDNFARVERSKAENGGKVLTVKGKYQKPKNWPKLQVSLYKAGE